MPDGVREHFAAGIGARGRELREAWMERFEAYREEHPELADHLLRMQRRELPDGWDDDIPEFPADAKGLAGRDASGKVLNAIARNVPWLVGGAADLAPSTKTRLTFEGAGDFSAEDRAGRNLHFGVREHAMGAVVNGLSLSKVRAFGSGFLIFSDYGRAPLRLAAIMEIPDDPRLHARLDRRRARTARRTSRSSTSPRCGRCRGSSRCARATRTRSRRRGG